MKLPITDRLAAAFSTALAALLLTIPAAGPWAESQPGERDYSTTRVSEKAAFTATYIPPVTPVPVGKLHTWKLHVEDGKGAAVTDAAIMVDGGMPQHGHGLPTRPRVTQNLGSGDYLVEGLRFQMRGWWVIRFTITAGGATDTVVFNLRL
jgi:hypothetical protein